MNITSQIINHYMAHVRGERRSALLCLLRPAELVSRLAAAVIDFMFSHGLRRVTEPPVPLISVGNLTYGGTNKTPFVEMLASELSSRGVSVGIVSRGYSGTGKNGVTLINSGSEPACRDDVGDEPLLLARRLPEIPVAVARHRIDGIKALADIGAELVIADDAFQHRSVARDADILLIDASCPFGNGLLIPSGVLRESVSAMSRAHIVVLTKADHVSAESLDELRSTVGRYVPAERIFTSRMKVVRWERVSVGGRTACDAPRGIVAAFSAIGSPVSFRRTLEGEGLHAASFFSFRDHHRYSGRELCEIREEAEKCGASAIVCTEKDLFNLPDECSFGDIPLLVPCVSAGIDDGERFWRVLADELRPRVVVASNGYGEDAIGVLLAERVRTMFPSAEVLAFPLVGRGDAYAERGFTISSAPSVTPSGGVVKYRLSDLLGDMRAGLLRHVSAQLKDWRKLRGRIRTPMCVGDVYLLLHALWGSGMRPMFAATAKTVQLSGHWRIERSLIRRFTIRTWTRDEGSAEQLRNAGADAVYAGSPIMDLLGTDADFTPPNPPDDGGVPLVLLLPGSRLRAYDDVNMLLDAAMMLNEKRRCSFRMVLAPTISRERLVSSCAGWREDVGCIKRDDVRVELTSDTIARAARDAVLLIGFGGTANQLCAGMGIPVIAADEKGKRVQKKLLGDSEILTEPSTEALAECALRVLGDRELYAKMSAAGRERMGVPGALSDMCRYAAEVLGLSVRERVYTAVCRRQCGA